MKKKYQMKNLDCANCAAKMETAIDKIEGVNGVSISFIGQKMTIDAEEENMLAIMEKVIKICKKIEPDCVIIV